jgi:hypothetical protein
MTDKKEQRIKDGWRGIYTEISYPIKPTLTHPTSE